MRVPYDNLKNNYYRMKMKIEIWSDVMCPFCYLGKRKLENALAQFADKERIEVEWKSFQLNPDLVTNPGINIQQYLSEHKGMSVEQVKHNNNYITQVGQTVGLEYHFDRIVVANTFSAQQLLKFAHTQGKQNEVEELVFEAFFTKGKNVDDFSTLLQLANEAGLDTEGLHEALENNQYAAQAQADMTEASQLGIHSVPYFVFNRKLAVNGAQESAVFLETLRKAFTDWAKDHPDITPRPVTFSYKPV
jgi:predicted DsbA family dithiol-disulfide isomerase